MLDRYRLAILYQLSTLLLVAGLAACAELPGPTTTHYGSMLTELSGAATRSQATDVSEQIVFGQIDELMQMTIQPPSSSSLVVLLGILMQTIDLPPEAAVRELALLTSELRTTSELRAAAELRTVDPHETARAADLEKRFRLACLLGRQSASERELAQAKALLEGLTHAFENESERQFVQLSWRYLALASQLQQQQVQTLKLRDQNRELLKKIEQLKGLERELDAEPSAIESTP